jgi:hypothetical protein
VHQHSCVAVVCRIRGVHSSVQLPNPIPGLQLHVQSDLAQFAIRSEFVQCPQALSVVILTASVHYQLLIIRSSKSADALVTAWWLTLNASNCELSDCGLLHQHDRAVLIHAAVVISRDTGRTWHQIHVAPLMEIELFEHVVQLSLDSANIVLHLRP